MRRWSRFRLSPVMFASVLWPVLAAAQAPPAGEPDSSAEAALKSIRHDSAAVPPGELNFSANAALQYMQAFSLMPALDKDQRKVLENWQTVPLDATAKELIDQSQNSLKYLHRGAKLTHCDWGLDYGDGISLLLPHLSKARDLAKLAALDARYHFEQGDRRIARENARAMMVLARHVGRDPIMICLLVRYLIEGLTVDLLAPHVADMQAPYAFVRSQYESLPPAPALQDTILAEKKTFIEWIIRHLRERELAAPGSWRKLWQNLLGAEAPDSLKEIGTLDEALRLLEDMLPVYDELARVNALPRVEFLVRYPQFKRTVETANPLAALLLPSIDKLRATEDRARVRLELLMAASAVAHSGPDALKEIKDPFGDGPFEYRALNNGFELKSELLHDGEPVTLRAGRTR